MKTILHAYSFYTSDPAGREAWLALKAKLEAMDLRCMESHGGGSHWLPDLDGVQVELETLHLFDNQWNTAPIPGDTVTTGRRVFDWALDYMPHGNPHLKRGHWLEQTDEMAAIRRDTSKCGYCGRQEPTGKFDFCPHCLDSEYLKSSDLHLTRMLPVAAGFSAARAPLTEAERPA